MNKAQHSEALGALYAAFADNANCVLETSLRQWGPVRILAGQTEAPPQRNQTEIVLADFSSSPKGGFVVDCFDPNLAKGDWCRFGIGQKADVRDGARLERPERLKDYNQLFKALAESHFDLDDARGELERLSEKGEVGLPLPPLGQRLGLLVTKAVVSTPDYVWWHLY